MSGIMNISTGEFVFYIADNFFDKIASCIILEAANLLYLGTLFGKRSPITVNKTYF